MKLRIGHGVDTHRFTKYRPLILGGVEIPRSLGLEGHSDADALTHAACDAILGALSMGDLGRHFPDTDPQYKDKSSLFFLERIRGWMEERGYQLANLDCTVVTEEPKLAPYVEAMRRKLANTLDVDVDQISIKATRPEGMGALGQKEGLLALATVLLTR